MALETVTYPILISNMIHFSEDWHGKNKFKIRIDLVDKTCTNIDASSTYNQIETREIIYDYMHINSPESVWNIEAAEAIDA